MSDTVKATVVSEPDIFEMLGYPESILGSSALCGHPDWRPPKRRQPWLVKLLPLMIKDPICLVGA